MKEWAIIDDKLGVILFGGADEGMLFLDEDEQGCHLVSFENIPYTEEQQTDAMTLYIHEGEYAAVPIDHEISQWIINHSSVETKTVENDEN